MFERSLQGTAKSSDQTQIKHSFRSEDSLSIKVITFLETNLNVLLMRYFCTTTKGRSRL